jgi:hypothetical protein
MRPRCHPRGSCSRQAENPVGSSLPPQTGRVSTTVPGRRRGRARYTTATRCGGFVVAPLLQEVPQRLGDELLLRCDDAGSLRNGGVGGVVGSG